MTTSPVSFAHDDQHLQEDPDHHSPDSHPADNPAPGHTTPAHAAPFADDWVDDDEFGEENETEMDTEVETGGKGDPEEDPPRKASHEPSETQAQGPAGQNADTRQHEHMATSVSTPDRREITHPEPASAPIVATGPVTGSPAVAIAPATSEARELLDGIAESLRTLGGSAATDGRAAPIFPRGVDLLEVRLHVSRERAIDLNFRVAGPAQSVNA
jgi:hypothetical protein